jgi:hypothetical protein
VPVRVDPAKIAEMIAAGITVPDSSPFDLFTQAAKFEALVCPPDVIVDMFTGADEEDGFFVFLVEPILDHGRVPAVRRQAVTTDYIQQEEITALIEGSGHLTSLVLVLEFFAEEINKALGYEGVDYDSKVVKGNP